MKFPGASEFRKAIENDTSALLDSVLDAAESRGLAVYAVGGPVRDLLLGKTIHDVDLLLETGDAVALATLAAPPDARVTRHDRFGTVRLQLGSASAIDLSVARRETYAHVGALPRVEPGSLEEDLARRDFTVNALALPLSSHAKREHSGIVDLADGIADLAAASSDSASTKFSRRSDAGVARCAPRAATRVVADPRDLALLCAMLCGTVCSGASAGIGCVGNW